MSAEHKQILRRFFHDVLERGDVGVLDSIVDRAFVDHQPAPGQGPGVDGIRQFVTAVRAGLSDLRVDVEHLIAEGELVSSVVTLRWKHTGDLMGLPPSGKDVSMRIADVVRVSNGKVVERWGVEDMSGLGVPAGG
jgi:predicted ester cyclase